MSPEAAVLVREVRAFYLKEKKFIPRHLYAEPIPIEQGFVRVAIVREEVQQKKMREAFAAQNKFCEESHGNRFFEDKRVTCFEQIYGAKESVELRNIFVPDKEGEQKDKIPKRILVLGRAGSGKSTVCQYMAYESANPNSKVKLWLEAGKDKFKLVVLVPLRNLLDYPDNEMTVSHVIHKECLLASKNDPKNKTLSLEEVKAGYEQVDSSEILYILDGFDEVAGKRNLLVEHLLNKENIILTSRPHGINQYLAPDNRFFDNARNFDRKFENIGFLDEDIDRYIEYFFRHNEESRNQGEALKDFLKKLPNIWGIAHIPINLMLICIGWKDNYGKFDLREIKDITITDLYLGLIANLGRRYLSGRCGVDGVRTFDLEKIVTHRECCVVLAVLSELAFEQMSVKSLLIPGKKLSEAGLRKRYPEILAIRENIINFGVLTPTNPDTDSESTEYYFIHLTFQDFLAAFHIAKRLRENDEFIKKYILKNKYSARYQMVWWFVAGLLKKESEVLEMFFDILEAEPRDLGQLYHQMLLIRCMDECQLAAGKRKNKFLSNLWNFIERSLDKIEFFYPTLVIYLELSQSVLSQSEILAGFMLLLRKGNRFAKQMAISVMARRADVPKEINDAIAALLEDPDAILREYAIYYFRAQKEISSKIIKFIIFMIWDIEEDVRDAAIGFLRTQKTIALDILNHMAMLIKSNFDLELLALSFSWVQKKIKLYIENGPDGLAKFKSMLKLIAINFFRIRAESPSFLPEKELLDDLFLLLKDPKTEKEVRLASIGFFRLLKIVPPEAFKEIMLLLDRQDWDIRHSAFDFFREQQEKIPSELFEHLVSGLTNSDSQTRLFCVIFFRETKIFLPNILKDIVALLKDPDKNVKIATIEYCKENKGVLPSSAFGDIEDLLTDPDSDVKKVAVGFFYYPEERLPEVLDKIVKLLSDPDKKVILAAICILDNQKEISLTLFENIELLLESSDDEISNAAVRLFIGRKELPLEALPRIFEWLKSPNTVLRKAAAFFIRSQKAEGKEDYTDHMTDLLGDSCEEVSAVAVGFFRHQKIVPREALNRIVRLLMESADNSYIVNCIMTFFDRPKEVLPEFFNSVKLWLTYPRKNIRRVAVFFFHAQKIDSPETLEDIASLLEDSDGDVREATIKLFLDQKNLPLAVLQKLGKLLPQNDKNVQIIQIIKILDKTSIGYILKVVNALDKENIDSEFLKVLVTKLLVSNIPMYQKSENCIQVGDPTDETKSHEIKFGEIKFSSSKELARFVKKIQQAFQELIGFDFEENLEESSPAEAMAVHGKFPGSPKTSDADEPKKLNAEIDVSPCRIL